MKLAIFTFFLILYTHANADQKISDLCSTTKLDRFCIGSLHLVQLNHLNNRAHNLIAFESFQSSLHFHESMASQKAFVARAQNALHDSEIRTRIAELGNDFFSFIQTGGIMLWAEKNASAMEIDSIGVQSKEDLESQNDLAAKEEAKKFTETPLAEIRGHFDQPIHPLLLGFARSAIQDSIEKLTSKFTSWWFPQHCSADSLRHYYFTHLAAKTSMLVRGSFQTVGKMQLVPLISGKENILLSHFKTIYGSAFLIKLLEQIATKTTLSVEHYDRLDVRLKVVTHAITKRLTDGYEMADGFATIQVSNPLSRRNLSIEFTNSTRLIDKVSTFICRNQDSQFLREAIFSVGFRAIVSE